MADDYQHDGWTDPDDDLCSNCGADLTNQASCLCWYCGFRVCDQGSGK